MTARNQPARPDTDPAELPYVDALAEVEAILAELEADDVDVDVLVVRVQRAAALLTALRQRVGTAREGVEQVMAELDRVLDDTE